MTLYAAYEFPLLEQIPQDLSDSLNTPAERPSPYALFALDFPILATLNPRGLPAWVTRGHSAYVFPDWSGSFLFGHILVSPPRLDLGNLLSTQTRTVEYANLFTEPQDLESLTTDVAGLTFVVAPALPFPLAPFGSVVIEVSIAADGPAAIDGEILAIFEGAPISVPVTGTRIIVFQYQPQQPFSETLEYKTDVLVAIDGTEQRITIRAAPRARLSYSCILDHESDGELRGKLFDWVARVFALPIWSDARASSGPAAAGALSIAVPTAAGDFRVGALAFLWTSNHRFEAAEITAIAAGALTFASALGRDYPAGTLVMPARIAFAQTVPSAPRIPRTLTRYAVEFVTVDNRNLADTTGSVVYDGRVLLEDCNLIVSGEADAYERTVTVLDNDSGRVYQTSHVDRSRFRTQKVWDCPSQAELWRVRRLLHHFAGSQRACWLPTFRADLELTDTIGPSSTTFRIRATGFTAFYQARRPFADVRLVKTDGTAILRRIIGSVVDSADPSVEVITVSAAFAGTPIAPAQVERIEFVLLVRIADDSVSITHNRLGDATVEINLVSVKE
jgi:hypothetical protein